jgi:hypothetical protein
MKFTKNEINNLRLSIKDDEKYVIYIDNNQIEEIKISIDSDNKAELFMSTSDEHLVYELYTSGCISEISFFTKDGKFHKYETVWDIEHENFNTYEYMDGLYNEITYLYIIKK